MAVGVLRSWQSRRPMADQHVHVRVCPSCGEPCAARGFCAHCGFNLSKVDRLPTLEEWRAEGARRWNRRTGARKALVGLAVAAVIVLAAVFVVLTQRTELRTMRTPSEAMEPTIALGAHFTVNEHAYDDAQPKIGEIVVFHPPLGAETNVCGDRGRAPDQVCRQPTPELSPAVFLKRIVAGPGDELYLKDGNVYVNGRRQEDGFARPCAGGTGCDFPRPVRVPEGMWFTLGDNLGESDDSRFWGPVPREALVGRVESCALLGLFCHAAE
jgi:signal peptidase I